jgi:putative oxidoreductase
MLLQHATMKLFGFPPSPMTPPLFSLFGIAGMIELVFGLLLLMGLFSRLAAFILSGEVASAYFIAHAPHSFFPIVNGGESAVLFCFAFLYLAAAGPGPFAVDRLRGGSAAMAAAGAR